MEYDGAVLYTRISKLTEESTAIARQDQDCRRRIEQMGLDLLATYSDPDLSAWKKTVVRPNFGRMMADIESGRHGKVKVVVYALDRFTRQPREGEDILELIKAGKCGLIALADGIDQDVGRDSMNLRIKIVMAAEESERISLRVRNSRAYARSLGVPPAGGRRPYGHEMDKTTIVPTEADVIRDLVERFLRGESLNSMAQMLRDSGTKTLVNKEWTAWKIKNIISKPRIAGLVDDRNGTLRGGMIEPIVTKEQWEAVVRKLADPTRKTAHDRSLSLLGGLLVCSRCGQTMVAAGPREYRCKQPLMTAGGSCGGTVIARAPLETLVAETVLRHFENAPAATPRSSAALDDLLQQREALTEEARRARHSFQKGWTAERDYEVEIVPLNRAIAEVERQIHVHQHRYAIENEPALGFGAAWEQSDISRRRAMLAGVIQQIVVNPPVRGRHFDPGRLHFVWYDKYAAAPLD